MSGVNFDLLAVASLALTSNLLYWSFIKQYEGPLFSTPFLALVIDVRCEVVHDEAEFCHAILLLTFSLPNFLQKFPLHVPFLLDTQKNMQY